MTKDLFIGTINAMKFQSDNDKNQAQKLIEIYGSDINPHDNRALTDAMFDFLKEFFPQSIEEIQRFCFEQDFGRATNSNVEALWWLCLREMEVVDPVEIAVRKKPYSRELKNEQDA